MTKGECGFQEFCKRNSIIFEPIARTAGKSPDYRLSVGDTIIIAEVKDIEMNDEEKQACQAIELGQARSWGSNNIGSRVRDAIGKANRQLSQVTQGKLPGILILFDNRPWPFNIVFPYEIMVAMYGLETCDFAVSRGLSPPATPVIVGRRFGKGRKCGPSHNTSTSAVGVMLPHRQDGRCEFVVYHNQFAAVSISPCTFGSIETVKQFALKRNTADEFGDWAPHE
ncbi:MAG: hypothetical protein ABSC19_20550 [Syntrophorhabdales bacterium]|jgi:hypothetical protein